MSIKRSQKVLASFAIICILLKTVLADISALKFKLSPGTKITGQVLKSTSSPRARGCALHCHDHHECFGFSYERQSGACHLRGWIAQAEPSMEASHEGLWTSGNAENIKIGDHCPVTEAMVDGTRLRIPDSAFTASSNRNKAHCARAGISGNVGPGCIQTGWTPSENDNQWIQVDFGELRLVESVLTLVEDGGTECVKSFNLEYGLDDATLQYYKDGDGGNKVFTANVDCAPSAESRIVPAIRSRFVRINPLAYIGHVMLRFEIRGCRLFRSG